ncbi:hypothetical protein GE107_05135 [Cohnella sp. CFH 77786]|uniref:hypothetical protein n=1 Tax=Cohnella sp. CFH 77786 TaxID=2662265 RepID=UPI001C60C211|nr:hypothetical protein [Cohnella sp. CFH 77786]MBW5445444.1 hypothetical protein [Cohnella sp. CFH 77786]
MTATSKKSVLPVASPMISLYAAHANALSVLENRPETMPWLLNRFVQIVCWQKDWVDYLDFDFRDCPLLDYQRLDKTFIRLKWGDDIVSFVRDAIDGGFYVSFLVKTRCVPAYIHGGDHCHELFVYGYDDHAKQLYIADNFDFGRYQRKTCSFEEAAEGYAKVTEREERTFYGAPQAKGAVQLIRYDGVKSGSVSLSFQPGLFVESMEDYLSGDMPRAGFNLYDYTPHAYGCKAVYQLAIRNIRELMEDPDAYFDVRRIHILWEHKDMMLRRLNYMAGQHMLPAPQIVDRYRELERNLHRARATVLKYFFTRDRRMLKEAVDLYASLMESDLEYGYDLLHQLKSG